MDLRRKLGEPNLPRIKHYVTLPFRDHAVIRLLEDQAPSPPSLLKKISELLFGEDAGECLDDILKETKGTNWEELRMNPCP